MSSLLIISGDCLFDKKRDTLPIAKGALATLSKLVDQGINCAIICEDELADYWKKWESYFNDEVGTDLQVVWLPSFQKSLSEYPQEILSIVNGYRRESVSMLGRGEAIKTISALLDIHQIDFEHHLDSSWCNLLSYILFPRRIATVERKTAETEIVVRLDLEAKGASKIETGIGFFDHMLDQIAKHADVFLEVKVNGDLEIDEHHSIEDAGIAIGQALLNAVGDKRGMSRYGFYLPMDEAAAQVALDFSGRPVLNWQVRLHRETVGDFPCEMAKHFFESLAISAGLTLHIVAGGDNDHHIIEAIFKAFGKALKRALKRDESDTWIPSTKGIL